MHYSEHCYFILCARHLPTQLLLSWAKLEGARRNLSEWPPDEYGVMLDRLHPFPSAGGRTPASQVCSVAGSARTVFESPCSNLSSFGALCRAISHCRAGIGSAGRADSERSAQVPWTSRHLLASARRLPSSASLRILARRSLSCRRRWCALFIDSEAPTPTLSCPTLPTSATGSACLEPLTTRRRNRRKSRRSQ